MRNQLEGDDGVGRVNERAMKTSRLDQDFAVSAKMGVLEVENGSINGRIATNAAASAGQQQIREKRQKRDREWALIVHQLHEALKRLDARIAELDLEIKELRQRHEEALLEADEAFTRMHELEDLLAAAETGGMTIAERNALAEGLGPEAKTITDDAELLALARKRIEEEHQTGITAQDEAEILRCDIEEKMDQLDELRDVRAEISNSSTLSLEEKASRAQEALDRSLNDNFRAFEKAEAHAGSQANQMADTDRDAQRSELDEAEMLSLTQQLTASPPSLSNG